MATKLKLLGVVLNLLCVPSALRAANAPRLFALQGTSGHVVLTDESITCVKWDEAEKPSQMLVNVNDEAKRKLADYTSSHIGNPLSIMVCGKEVSSPVIQGKIDSSTIHVGSLASADINCLKTLKDKFPCTEPKVHETKINQKEPVGKGSLLKNARTEVSIDAPDRVKKAVSGKNCDHVDNRKVHDKFGEIDHNLTTGYCLARALATKATPVPSGQERFGKALAELGNLDVWPSELWPRHRNGDKITIEVKAATSKQGPSIRLTSPESYAEYTVMGRGNFLPTGNGEQLLLWRDSAGPTSNFSTCQLVIVDTFTGLLEPLEVRWIGRCG